MSYITVDFDDGVPYASRRPMGTVVLNGPGGIHGHRWQAIALVDTGADFLHLPEEAATAVGISLVNVQQVNLLTAGGKVHMKQLKVDVEIQGILVNIPVNFAKNALPLIGRQAIFAILNTTGFSTSEWLLDWHKPQSHSAGTHGVQTGSNPSVPPQPASTSPLSIVDCGSYILVGGVKIDKRMDD